MSIAHTSASPGSRDQGLERLAGATVAARPAAHFSPASVRAVEAIRRTKIASSLTAGWQSVLVDRHTVDPDGEVLQTLATPDQTLVVVLRGHQEIEVLGRGATRRATYRAGTCGLTPPGTAETLRRLPGPGGGPVEKVNVYLPALLLDEAGERYGRAGVHRPSIRLSTLGIQDRTTTDTVIALARAAAAGAGELCAEAGALWLAMHLLEPGRDASGDADDPAPVTPRVHRGLQCVLELMASHYAENLTIERLAAEATVSKFHFIRVFRQLTGTTPYAHLVQVRLAAAHQLLLSTDLSVGQVATRCGFTRPNHFSTAFRAHYGHSPSQFRAARQGGHASSTSGDVREVAHVVRAVATAGRRPPFWAGAGP